MRERYYLCIDLKSFYASVECVERGLDPMTTNLVVADPERGDKTICLAVSPSMKAQGVRNRCRVFEIPPHIPYIMAPPRMQKYIDYAAEIYGIYLMYIAKEDIHVYSIDEAFLDVTAYLRLYRMTARQLALCLMERVRERLGVRAACGIGTNLYLAKVALDITAKHTADFIGELTETRYRETMWDHRPLTDFWRVGAGTAGKLAQYGIFTMRDIAYASEDILYRWFGVDAELLIDHAWGRETTTMADIKSYRSKTACVTSGQVLMRDYDYGEGLLILREMTDTLCLELTAKGLVTGSVTLHVGRSKGQASVHGTAVIAPEDNTDAALIPPLVALYRRIVPADSCVRRFTLTCNRVSTDTGARQVSLFEDPRETERARKLQQAMLGVKARFGKNSLIRGMSLEEAATARERNRQIGGHKSGE